MKKIIFGGVIFVCIGILFVGSFIYFSKPSTTNIHSEPSQVADTLVRTEFPTAGFSIEHRKSSYVSETMEPNSTSWGGGTGGTPGTVVAEIIIDEKKLKQSNFATAKVTIGYSTIEQVDGRCYFPSMIGYERPFTSATIGGLEFKALDGIQSDEGGLAYQKSYFTIHDGKCYSIGYNMYSENLNANAHAPLQPGIDKFTLIDKDVVQLLEEVVQSFRPTSKGLPDDQKQREEQYKEGANFLLFAQQPERN